MWLLASSIFPFSNLKTAERWTADSSDSCLLVGQASVRWLSLKQTSANTCGFKSTKTRHNQWKTTYSPTNNWDLHQDCGHQHSNPKNHRSLAKEYGDSHESSKKTAYLWPTPQNGCPWCLGLVGSFIELVIHLIPSGKLTWLCKITIFIRNTHYK